MPLRLLCDEQVGQATFYPQLNRKFTTIHVINASSLGSGADDVEVWRHACNINYNVLTADHHFVDGTANPQNGTLPGVIFYDDRAKINNLVDALAGIDQHLTSSEIAKNDETMYVPDG